jgi:SAM-dependent methyltransferase
MTRKFAEHLHRKYCSSPAFDGSSRFFDKIKAVVDANSHVLNLGAGPQTNDARIIKPGSCKWLVGADIDRVVLENRELDEGRVITDGRLPFDDNCFDGVFSVFVLEHVEHPRQFLGEVHRVLKPGGRYFFRTPNIYHYVTLTARLTPHAFHEWVANPARGLKAEAHAPWPTFFRMNSRAKLKTLAHDSGLEITRLDMIEGHPAYLMFNGAAFLGGMAYERLVNAGHALEFLRCNIQGELRKPLK